MKRSRKEIVLGNATFVLVLTAISINSLLELYYFVQHLLIQQMFK